MKLRIRGNSVRFRLGQSEVQRLAAEGAVEEVTQFDIAGKQRLVYRLETAGNAASVEASFESGILLVRIPAEEAHRWASSEQVGIEMLQAVGGIGDLKILIEKDFECIDARPDEPQDDAFPHPAMNNACAPADTARPSKAL
jgi:hypothetical protein